jgi:hypothetical protein
MLAVVMQVLQQPDERRAGGQSARQHALEQLVVKYCSSRGGGPRSNAQVGPSGSVTLTW